VSHDGAAPPVGRTESVAHSLGGGSQHVSVGTSAGGRAVLTEEDLTPTMNLARRFGLAREGGTRTLKGCFDILEGHEAGRLVVMRLLAETNIL
jgi:hypothetical protein